MAAGLLLGLCAPALGPSMRAQWREIALEGPRRRVAYSIDSIAEESLYLVGPLAAGVILATCPARVGLFLSACLIAIGTTGLVTSPYVPACASAVPTERVSAAGPTVLRRSGVVALLLVLSMAGAAGAACFVGVAATADAAGVPGAVGVIEAGLAIGSILAGVAWARLSRDTSWSTTLGLLLLVSGLAQAGAAVATPHLVLVGVTLIAMGAASAPIFVVAFTGADTLVAPDQRTEASTWVSTAFNGGNALGTALAGLVLTLGHTAPFALATCATALASATPFAIAIRARQGPASK